MCEKLIRKAIVSLIGGSKENLHSLAKQFKFEQP